jgi:hypothetical protein
VNAWSWVALGFVAWVMIGIPLGVVVGRFIKTGSGDDSYRPVDDWNYDDQRLFR